MFGFRVCGFYEVGLRLGTGEDGGQEHQGKGEGH